MTEAAFRAAWDQLDDRDRRRITRAVRYAIPMLTEERASLVVGLARYGPVRWWPVAAGLVAGSLVAVGALIRAGLHPAVATRPLLLGVALSWAVAGPIARRQRRLAIERNAAIAARSVGDGRVGG